MHEYLIDRQTLGLREVQRLAGSDGRFRFADAVGARLLADRQVVEQRLEEQLDRMATEIRRHETDSQRHNALRTGRRRAGRYRRRRR